MPYISREMLIRCSKKKRKNVGFYQRSTTVPFSFVNHEVGIRVGDGFKSYTYRKKQMGLKLGEFAKTRPNIIHKKRRIKIHKKRPKIKSAIYTYDLKSKFFTS